MPDPLPTQQFRIATWNVHMGLHNEGGRIDIATAVKELEADVVVLQEAWWYGEATSDLVQHAARAIGGEVHTYTSPSPMRRYPAQWTVAVITTLPAERLDDVPIVMHSGIERAMVRIRLTGTGITIAGGHLDGIHALRTRPLLWIRQRRQFREICADNDIVLGDLNMWSPVVHRDARPLRGAVRGKTWPWKRPHSQIDHILVSERLDVVDGDVMPDRGSDHLAVRATLRVRGD